jgi:HAD superfamily hydrolase (TIGR01509 family)
MDGVIVDSNPLHVEAWRDYLASLGVEVPDLGAKMYGRRNEELVVDLLPWPVTAEVAAKHGAAKEVVYRERMASRVQDYLVPGLLAFLEQHRARPIALATNAEPLNMDFVLDGAEIRHYFRFTLNGHQVSRPKPDPEIYLRLADMLSVTPAECLVFEDSLTGAAAARAAGMRVVGIQTTYAGFPDVDLAVPHFDAPELHSWLSPRLRPLNH